jgi:hypothetical protein
MQGFGRSEKEKINGEKEKDIETAGTNHSGQPVEIQTNNR